jgi:hypothetical protein
MGLGPVAETIAATGVDGTVRVSAYGTRIQGSWRQLTTDSVAVAERRLALTAVDTLWISRRAIGRGARIGALVGAGALGLFGYWFASGFCYVGTSCVGENAVVAGAGVLVGAAGGALIGAGIGATTVEWRIAFP